MQTETHLARYRRGDYTNLARDIAVLTANALYTKAEVARAYGIRGEELALLLEDDAFKADMSRALSGIGSGDHALLRAQARLMAEGNLRDIQTIANDAEAKMSDRLKAHAMILELADAKPKPDADTGGIVVNIGFGSLGVSVGKSVKSANTGEVIDHE